MEEPASKEKSLEIESTPTGFSYSNNRYLDNFIALRSIAAALAYWFRRKIPFVMQMNAIECGAACLAMILNYYGRQTDIREIRASSGIGRDGLSALQIVRAARNYGLQARAFSLPDNNFSQVALPAIIHWEFNHFIIVEHWTPGMVIVLDPAIGRKRLLADEFDAGFTGVVMTFEPDTHFARRKYRPGVTLLTYIKRTLRQSPVALLQILGSSLVLQLFGLIFPFATQVIIDQVLLRHMQNMLPILAMGLFMIPVAQGVTMLLRGMLLIYLQTRIDLQIIPDFFRHLLSLPLRFFQQRSTGDILTRLHSNTDIRDIVSNQLTSTLLDGCFILVYLTILLTQSLTFSLFVLLISGIQTLLLLCTTPAMRSYALRELDAAAKSQSYETEVVTGIGTLKAAGAEERAITHWLNLFGQQLNISVRQLYLAEIIDTLIDSLNMLAPLMLLIIGTMEVLRGEISIGKMLALNTLAISCLLPMSSFIRSCQHLQTIQAHLTRISDVLETEAEQDSRIALQPPPLQGNITLNNVSFRYDPQSEDVLRNISIAIRAGQRVALVGPTGSGKSTLGKLLLGLYTPGTGEVFYDGIPLQALDYHAVRAQFGVVMQDAHIFSGSIRQNIAFNVPDMEMERVISAARNAGLHADIERLPMGYETFIAEEGSTLSGGQCQRLAIARALAHDPAILLLDEATSALDVLTEEIVAHNLARLNCTQIIIAHRLSTVRSADLILVLNDGRVVEQGTHQELLHRSGYYARLIRSQENNQARLASGA